MKSVDVSLTYHGCLFKHTHSINHGSPKHNIRTSMINVLLTKLGIFTILCFFINYFLNIFNISIWLTLKVVDGEIEIYLLSMFCFILSTVKSSEIFLKHNYFYFRVFCFDLVHFHAITIQSNYWLHFRVDWNKFSFWG